MKKIFTLIPEFRKYKSFLVFSVLSLAAVTFLTVFLIQKPKDIKVGLGAAIPGDCDGVNGVDILDFQLLSNTFGKVPGDPGYDARCNFTGEPVIDILDYQILSNNFGRTGATNTPSPSVSPTTTPTLSPNVTASPTPTTPPVGSCSTINVRCVPQEYTTIQLAVDASVAGDTVLVSNGTYVGFTINKKIIVTATTFDTNDPTQNGVLINGQVSTTGGSSWAWDQGPTVRGFKINGPDPVVMNASPMTLEYNYITGTGGDNVSFESGGGIIRGNRIQDPADDNIDIDNQTKNILIENNYILNAHEEGIEMRQQNSTLSQRLDVIVRGNRIEASPSDGFQIMDYNNFSNRRYVFERNLFIGNKKAGIAIMPSDITVEDLSAAPMPEPMYVVNNTFINNYSGIAGGANAVVLNNIFSGQTLFDLKSVGGNSEIKYNLFAVTPKLVGTNNLDSATTYTGNPLLSATYTLQSGSPAIDKGITQYSHTYNYDGSGGGSAQTITDYVINLTSGQYNGAKPDLGWKEF